MLPQFHQHFLHLCFHLVLSYRERHKLSPPSSTSMVLEETDRGGWIAVSYAAVVAALLAFASCSIVYYHCFGKSPVSHRGSSVIARESQGIWRIAWSFYSGSVGAWAIATAPAHAARAGWVGLIAYAVACGLPVVMVSFLGTRVKNKWPEVNSVGDFVMQRMIRFGPTARLLMIIVSLFSMAIFMIIEFTTTGSLFQDFVGTANYPIIIIIAVSTTAYTAYGGLMISIVTDQVQAIFSLVLILVLTILVAATFKHNLPADFGDLKEQLGPNEKGYSSLFVMPLCLISAVMSNEAFWQRVWTAKDEKALKGGALIAFFVIVVAVFTYGASGFLAAWAGLIDFDTANPNLYMFQVFRSGAGEGQATVSKGAHVLVLVLAASMNQAAVDSFINGMTAALASNFLRLEPVVYARVCVLLATIPVCVIAMKDIQITQLFVTANMLGLCCLWPLVMGVYWDSPLGRRVLSESSMVFSSVCTVLVMIAYGTWNQWDGELSSSVSIGAEFAFVTQPYRWDYFLVVCCSSWGSALGFGVAAEALRRCVGFEGKGVTDALSVIPGYRSLVQDPSPLNAGRLHRRVMSCLGHRVISVVNLRDFQRVGSDPASDISRVSSAASGRSEMGAQGCEQAEVQRIGSAASQAETCFRVDVSTDTGTFVVAV